MNWRETTLDGNAVNGSL